MNFQQVLDGFTKNNRRIPEWDEQRNSAAWKKCNASASSYLTTVWKCYQNYCVSYNDNSSMFPEVQISDVDFNACHAFAQSNSLSHELWMTRNAYGKGSKADTETDEENGKIGEFVVSNTLRQLGIGVTSPDLNIYPPNQKSFDNDLSMTIGNEKHGVSIKTFTPQGKSSTKVSWVLQLSESDGKCGKDKHFFGDDDSIRQNLWFAAVALHPDRRHGRILAFMPMQTLHDAGVYEELELDKYKDTKRAVYWDTLHAHGLLPNKIALPFTI